MSSPATLPSVVGPRTGRDLSLGLLGTVLKVASPDVDGRIAIVEHSLPARTLAAPLHRHSREDELSIVLDGTIGARLGDEVVIAGPGTYVLKPRGQWHTFWNAGDEPLRFVEIIVPGGFEGYFERLSSILAAPQAIGASALERVAAEYGIEFDVASVAEVCAAHGVRYG